MSPVYRRPAVDVYSFPRVSGDEPRGEAFSIVPNVFSPRERG